MAKGRRDFKEVPDLCRATAARRGRASRDADHKPGAGASFQPTRRTHGLAVGGAMFLRDDLLVDAGAGLGF